MVGVIDRRDLKLIFGNQVLIKLHYQRKEFLLVVQQLFPFLGIIAFCFSIKLTFVFAINLNDLSCRNNEIPLLYLVLCFVVQRMFPSYLYQLHQMLFEIDWLLTVSFLFCIRCFIALKSKIFCFSDFRLPNFTLKVFQCQIDWIEVGMVVE